MNANDVTSTRFHDPSSDALKVVLMMYDGSIDYLNKAIEFADVGDTKTKNVYTHMANDIIIELDKAVDLASGGDISLNLKKLYSFMNRHLIQAVQNENIQGLKNVKRILSDLRDSWQYVDDVMQNEMPV